jgi:hypothetical protein
MHGYVSVSSSVKTLAFVLPSIKLTQYYFIAWVTVMTACDAESLRICMIVIRITG